MKETKQDMVLYMMLMSLSLVGAINWGLIGYFNFDMLGFIKDNTIRKFVLSLIGMSGLILFFMRDTHLPFLGRTILPDVFIADKKPISDEFVLKVKLKPNTKVIYWASNKCIENCDKLVNYKQAYNKYKNSGTTTTDENGFAHFYLEEPQRYFVKGGKMINRHVHFRYVEMNGVLSRIYTIYF